MFLPIYIRECVRDDYRINITSNTDSTLSAAYNELDELFYGVTCSSSEVEGLEVMNSNEDDLASSDEEDQIEKTMGTVETGSEDSHEMIIVGLDDEKKLVYTSRIRKGCGCHENCYDQFSKDEIYSIRLQN